ncbi:VLRF1 family aeRF1-type release factor [Bacillus alkalicellulosilyticus]|uniref:VLRF1 family aeRF1-type release factor n=1 Tax=Alkalihalobacterium alkalicellulosilyticum TaxID=1912214 RepID=UPI0009971C6D|nr:VLRF1 family aeRF1-type release factor [Bacillus alkalicellulosilyticus]
MGYETRMDRLTEFSCEQGVITIYLNTVQEDQWRIRLKNGLKKLEQYIQLSGNEEEVKHFKKVKKKVAAKIKGHKTKMERGLLLFASADGRLLDMKTIPIEVDTEFHWEEKPVLDQMKLIDENYPRTGIIVVQQHDVLALDVDLGEVLDEMHYSYEIEEDEWRRYEGVAATERMASGTNQTDKVDERRLVNQKRWIKGILPIIEQQAKLKKWTNIYIVGTGEIARTVNQHLNKKVQKYIPKNLFPKKNQEIVKEVLS